MLGVLAREVLITAKVSSFVLLLRAPEINPTRRFLSLTAAKPDKLPHALSQRVPGKETELIFRHWAHWPYLMKVV